MDSKEFRSEGVGPQPKDWHSSARTGVTEPLGSQGAHAWLPALLGHGAAWHRDAPAPHLLASRDDLGLGQRQDSPMPSFSARCPRSILASAAPGEHWFGNRRAAGAPGSMTGQHLPRGCGGADGGMQGEEQTRDRPHSLGREALPWRNVTSARLACASKSPCHIRADPRAAGERSVPGARGAEGV